MNDNNIIRRNNENKEKVVIINSKNTAKINDDMIDSSSYKIIKFSYEKIYLNYNDYELNSMSYEEALIKDKRSYFQYYFSLLKTKHLLIFTFYTSSDYNSKIIKIILFFFFFALYYTVNALFFTDSTMHQIYIEQGRFNFIYQIPQIIYSTIISEVIHIIVKYLSLSEKNIIEIKKEKKNINEKGEKILKKLIIKFVLFFIISYLFLIFFWYYLSCFCTVYRNTQIHLIKDTLISFGSSLIYPLAINLLPGIFRIISLKSPKKDAKCFFFISTILQLF